MSMTVNELLALHKALSAEALEIMKQKNNDYTSGGGVFDNFRNAEVLGVSGELGLLIRVVDKLMRLRTFITQGTLQVKGESVRDAVLDIINYMVLLAGMIQEKDTAKAGPGPASLRRDCAALGDSKLSPKELEDVFNGVLYSQAQSYRVE